MKHLFAIRAGSQCGANAMGVAVRLTRSSVEAVSGECTGRTRMRIGTRYRRSVAAHSGKTMPFDVLRCDAVDVTRSSVEAVRRKAMRYGDAHGNNG